MKHVNFAQKQQGFAIGLILGVIALMAILGAVFATSINSTSVDVSSESARISAAAILTQAYNQRAHFDIQTARGEAVADVDVRLDQIPPKDGVLDPATAAWAKVTGNPTLARLSGLNQQTCQWINFLIGDASDAATAPTQVAADATETCVEDPTNGFTFTKVVFTPFS
jgi:type II secretory pathway pseudopilin PulG